MCYRLAYRRQIDIFPSRHLHVIEADDPYIVRYGKAGILDRAEDTDGKNIIAAEIRLCWRTFLQKALHFRPTSIKGIGRGKRVGEGHIGMGRKCVLKPGETVLGGCRRFGTTQESDPLVATFDKRLGRHAPAFPVVDTDHMHLR